MRRRTYLIGGVTVLAGLAGCGSPGGGVTQTSTTASGGGTPTKSSTGTQMGTTTGTSGPTGTGSPAGTGTGTGTEMGTGTGTGTEMGTGTGTGTPGPSTGTPGTATGTGTAGMTTTVEMVATSNEFYFDPVGLAVQPGDTVTWTIKSGGHSSTAYPDRIPTGATAWDSGILTSVGETFSQTFDVEGTYDYYCVPHQSLGMVARIVVGQPGGPAEGTMPPDGDVPDSQTIVDQGSVSYAEFSSS